MSRKILTNLKSELYEHPFDRKALAALEKMPGVPLLLRKLNEYGIDRLLKIQSMGCDIRVNSRNFPQLYEPFLEACQILEISPMPELYLTYSTGNIKTLTVGVEQPIININCDGLERLSYEELIYVFGHELAHIKSRHLVYHQTAIMFPTIKTWLSNTTLGLGGLVSSGVEMALYNWLMMAKLSSDRAGLLACQNLDVATTALMKLAGLRDPYINSTIIEEFTQQAREFKLQNLNNLDKFTKLLSFMDYWFPWAVMRASELYMWVDKGAYDALLQDNPKIEVPTPDPTPVETGEWDFLTSWEKD